jgi:site-specific DNA recombinase
MTGTEGLDKVAAVYARFSSDLQRDRSITDQFALCEGFAKREGIKIVARFSDRAKSGASMFDRDGLIELREAAKRREFNAIIVESLDRLSRDQEDLAGLYKRLSHYGVEILTVNEGKTSAIHVGIRGLFGSLFLADLGAKIKRGHDGRVREGRFPGAVTYGYDRVPGRPGERVINEKEAEVVRRIFQQYASGESPRAIAEALTSDGIPTPDGAKHWNHQTFVGGSYKRGIIGNRLYIGEIIWNTHRSVKDPDTGKTLKRPTPESEHMVTKVPELRIIDQELWDTAQAIRERRAVTKFGPGGKVLRRPVAARDAHLLAGVLRCGACNSHMRIGQVSRNGSARVVCAAAHQHGTCQHRKSYDIEVLKKTVLDNFRTSLIDPERIKKATKAYHDEYERAARESNAERQAAIRQLNKVKVQIDRIVNTIIDVGNSSAMSAALKEREAERAHLEERVRLLSADTVVEMHPAAIKRYVASIEELHRKLTSGDAVDEAKAAFRNIIDSIIVHPTPKRADYEISAYGRLSAIMGIDLSPPRRTNAQILESEGISCIETGHTEKSVSS